MNKIKFPKHLKTVVLASLLALTADTESSLAEVLSSPTDTLSKNEMVMKGRLDKFIDMGYDCVVDVADFVNEGNVIDAEGLLTNKEENLLEDMIENLKEKNGVKILLVTKEGMTKSGNMSDFGTNLGQCLGVGLKNVDNGLLVQLDALDHKTFISTGYATETVITDAESGRITRLSDDYFREGDFYGGLQAILEGIDKSINPEEEKEMQDNIKRLPVAPVPEPSTLLLFVIGMGVVFLAGGGFSISTINNKKREYDKLVKEYNGNQEKLIDQIKKWTASIVELETQQEKIEKIDLEKFPWAKDVFKPWQELFEKEKELFYSESSSKGVNIKDDFGKIAGTWGGFVTGHGKKIQEESEQDKERKRFLDEKLGDIQTLSKLGRKNNLTFLKIQNIGSFILALKEKLSIIRDYIKELVEKGYSFPGVGSNIAIQIVNIERDIEILESQIPDLDDNSRGFVYIFSLYEEIELLEQQLDGNKNSLISLVSLYEKQNHDRKSKEIGSNIIEIYSESTQELSKLVPENILRDYRNNAKKLNEYMGNQKVFLKKYEQAYNLKDLEGTRDNYESSLELYNKSISLIDVLSMYIMNQKEAKDKLGKKIESGEGLLNKMKLRLHNDYKSKYKTIKSEFEVISKKAGEGRADWLELYKDLKVLLEGMSKIIKNSVAQFAADKRAKERAEERRNSNNNTRTSTGGGGGGGGSNNYGGGGFGGGGGGSNW